MKRLAVIFILVFYFGLVNLSYARRVKEPGLALYSWNVEELDLVKRGYVLIYDSSTGERIGTFKRQVRSIFLAGHKGIVVKKQLDSGGFFSLGLPKTHQFPNYPNAFVIAEMPFNSTISKMCLYSNEGELLKDSKIIKIFSADGELTDCYFSLSTEEFNSLNNVSIETELDKNGYFQIGGRIRGHFEKYPHSKVLVKVQQGVITSVSFLDETGDVFDAKECNLIYDKKFHLTGSSYRDFPKSFQEGVFYLQRKIGESGRLVFRGKEIAVSPQYSGCTGFIKVINGRAEKFWIVDEGEVIAGKAPSNFNLESYIKNL